MESEQPDFLSLRIIRDNTILLSLASEYMSEEVFMVKIGKEVKKCLSVLKNDIVGLKKQFPGKFTQEVNTESILSSFETTAEEMISGSDEIINSCSTGKLGNDLNTDVDKITAAIDKIWHQVRGGDVKYSATDSISTFFGRFNIFSGIARLFKSLVRSLIFVIVILLAAFSYLYFTMEKETPILEKNKEITAFIDSKEVILTELEKKKAEASKDLKKEKNNKLLRKNMIAILELETRIQELNNKIHMVEGQIEARKSILEKNNKKLEEIRNKPFLDKLLKQ